MYIHLSYGCKHLGPSNNFRQEEVTSQTTSTDGPHLVHPPPLTLLGGSVDGARQGGVRLRSLRGNHDLGAVLSRLQRDLLADAATGSRDEDHPTGQLPERQRSPVRSGNSRQNRAPLGSTRCRLNITELPIIIQGKYMIKLWYRAEHKNS